MVEDEPWSKEYCIERKEEVSKMLLVATICEALDFDGLS